MKSHIQTAGAQAGESRSTATQGPDTADDFQPETPDALIKAFGAEWEPFTRNH